MDDPHEMRELAEKLRTSEALGRSDIVLRLFEFLLQQSLAGRCPKELEIAVEVLGRRADFDVAQDATVRVYVHKLRRKLEEHYARTAASSRLVIPKGEYRLALEPAPQTLEPTAVLGAAPAERWVTPKLPWLMAVLVVSVIANLVLLAPRLSPSQHEARAPRGVLAHPLWKSVLDDDLPIYIVVGNYYIFGEADRNMDVRRLIREFNINSRADLQQYLYQHPELSSQYINLDLSYLPIATAFALRDLMPILALRKKRLEVVLTSDITAQMFKSSHMIYIGYLSGMGMLRDLAFAKSRFSVGQTYDELIDRVSKRNYVSQAGTPLSGEILYRDYGYLSSFIGPNGNQILIVAGTRDVAVMHSAEILTNPAKLRELEAAVPDARGFEALYEVSGIDRMNVNGRLLVAAPLDTAGTWVNDAP